MSSFNTTFSEWGKIKHGIPQGSILGPLFFLIYINDLPNMSIIADPLKPILFADDTSIIITDPSPSKFKEDINNIVDNKNDWFRGNSLSLNFDKTYFVQFRPKNIYEINMKISCDNKLIKETKNTIFLGLDVDSSLSWKNHIDQMMIKLRRACYATRYVEHFMSQDTLRTIYFLYFHSILSYGIILWGNSAYSSNIFKILLFVAKNRDLYELNSEIYNINTRSSYDLHTPPANLTTFQKGSFYFGIKVFNYLPTSIKNTSHDINQFISILKSFLIIN